MFFTFVIAHCLEPTKLLYDKKSRLREIQRAPLQDLLEDSLIWVQRPLC